MKESYFKGMNQDGRTIRFASNAKQREAVKVLQEYGMSGLDLQADNWTRFIQFADSGTATQAYDILDSVENVEAVWGCNNAPQLEKPARMAT
jgi:hypothetical protein